MVVWVLPRYCESSELTLVPLTVRPATEEASELLMPEL